MRTKTVVTVGPAIWGESVLEELVTLGVRIFRLNFSHGDAASFENIVRTLRRLERENNIPLTILQDLSGPKNRIGELGDKTLEIGKGDPFHLGVKGEEGGLVPHIPFEGRTILRDLQPGNLVVLSDGTIQFTVDEVLREDLVQMTALNSGLLTSRKGIAFPGKRYPHPALTDKDRTDIREGARLGVDCVAMSFVQDPEDIRELKEELARVGSAVPVLPKLEQPSAVEQLDAILECSDGLLLARGDLGIECPLESLPELQKRIIQACNAAGKPVIVATQMLLSMVDSPIPTRAETTDVANAVLDGADCLMLSEETAVGKYPLETVGYMQRIARNAESYAFERFGGPKRPPEEDNNPPWFLAYSACIVAEKSAAGALVGHTNSGATGLLLSACRPRQRLFALTPGRDIARFLNLAWGLEPRLVTEDIPDHLTRAEHFVQSSKEFETVDKVVITAGHASDRDGRTPTNLVKLFTRDV
ncbi:MAG: pyruvate kinase [Desulfovibrionales bacterium]